MLRVYSMLTVMYQSYDQGGYRLRRYSKLQYSAVQYSAVQYNDISLMEDRIG